MASEKQFGYEQGKLFGLYGVVFSLPVAEVDFMERLEKGTLPDQSQTISERTEEIVELGKSRVALELAGIVRREVEMARARLETIDPQQRLFPVYAD